MSRLRGYASKEAPFVYQAWKNPEVLGIVSKIAGVDLVPCVDFEIGHINLSSSKPPVPNDEQTANELILNNTTKGEAKPIVDWHKDSYPFVVVTMLSDCTDMIVSIH